MAQQQIQFLGRMRNTTISLEVKLLQITFTLKYQILDLKHKRNTLFDPTVCFGRWYRSYISVGLVGKMSLKSLISQQPDSILIVLNHPVLKPIKNSTVMKKETLFVLNNIHHQLESMDHLNT